jgi:opacity protein-like surface antigen
LDAGRSLKPYVQIGAGAESTDIDRRILGQDFNFNLDAGFGIRYMITPRCSVNLEYRFQHFSDASMTQVNLGVNAQGALIGVSWFF